MPADNGNIQKRDCDRVFNRRLYPRYAGIHEERCFINITAVTPMRDGLKSRILFEGNAAIAGRYFKTAPRRFFKQGAAGDVIVSDYNPLTPMDASNINGHTLFAYVTSSQPYVTVRCL